MLYKLEENGFRLNLLRHCGAILTSWWSLLCVLQQNTKNQKISLISSLFICEYQQILSHENVYDIFYFNKQTFFAIYSHILLTAQRTYKDQL